MSNNRRGTNVFGSIAKLILESSAGRLRWRSNMWANIGSKWDKRRIVNTAMRGSPSVNEKCEFVKDARVLVRKPCTLCPEAPGMDRDKEFYFDGKWWWVPRVVCVECILYRPAQRGGHGFRFPRCTWKKETDPALIARQALVQLGETVGRAVEQAEKIVKGRI